MNANTPVSKQSIEPLYDGFLSFRRSIVPAQRSLYRELATGQKPSALFITCSDSRVVPALILQSQPGDLFVCRNAGNLIPPHGESAGDVAAAIEYAISVLNIPNIIVCGHTDCGAMKALLHPEKTFTLPSVAGWLRYAEDAKQAVIKNQPDLPEPVFLNELERQNVLTQLEHLKTHPAVADKIAAGTLRLYGWIYDIGQAEIFAYDAKEGIFTPLDERLTTALEPNQAAFAGHSA